MPAKLHPLKRGPRDNRYCGPAVISFLTGISTGEAAAAIRSYSGRRMVTGSHDWEVFHVLRTHGLAIEPLRQWRKDRPTLAGWLKESKTQRTAGRIFLVLAGNHWQIISGRRYACGRIGEVVSVRDKRVKRRARVESVHEIL